MAAVVMARREAVVTAAARWVLLESIALITLEMIINKSRLLLEKQIVKSFTKQRAGKVGGCEDRRGRSPQCKFNNCGGKAFSSCSHADVIFPRYKYVEVSYVWFLFLCTFSLWYDFTLILRVKSLWSCLRILEVCAKSLKVT